MSVVAGIGFVLIALVLIPLGVSWRASWPGGRSPEVAVRWAFGLVRFRFDLSGESERSPKKPAPRKRAAKKRGGDGAAFVRILRDAAARRRLLQFSRNFWGALNARDVHARLRFGFDDPADTGRWFGLASPLVVLLGLAPAVDLDVEPDFQSEVLELSTGGSIRVVPLVALWHVTALLLSRPIRRAVRRRDN